MKKAQNVIEVVLLGAMLVVVTVAVFTIYNNQKIKLVENSKVKTTDVAGLVAEKEAPKKDNVTMTDKVENPDPVTSNPAPPNTNNNTDSNGNTNLNVNNFHDGVFAGANNDNKINNAVNGISINKP